MGISVDSVTGVAKDAADVIRSQGPRRARDGVTEGRRIFANTLKYVLYVPELAAQPVAPVGSACPVPS